MTIPPSSQSGLRPPGELFGPNKTLPPLSELLHPASSIQNLPKAPSTQTPATVPDQHSVQKTDKPSAKTSVNLFEKPAGKALANGVWYDTSRRTRDGGVVRLLTLDPGKAELVPVFNQSKTPVSSRQIEADKSLVAAINASFFGNGIIGDIKSGKKISTDDHLPALDKVTDQRHFIAITSEGQIHTGLGGLSENSQAHYQSFIGGFPALYTRTQLKSLDSDIASGEFAKRANYSGASQQDSVSRSFIGITSNGKILLMAAGHGSERGKGVSMAEGARLMRELGASEAYILDGGGSTTIFARGVEHAHTDGRQVWSYLGIRAR